MKTIITLALMAIATTAVFGQTISIKSGTHAGEGTANVNVFIYENGVEYDKADDHVASGATSSAHASDSVSAPNGTSASGDAYGLNTFVDNASNYTLTAGAVVICDVNAVQNGWRAKCQSRGRGRRSVVVKADSDGQVGAELVIPAVTITGDVTKAQITVSYGTSHVTQSYNDGTWYFSGTYFQVIDGKQRGFSVNIDPIQGNSAPSLSVPVSEFADEDEEFTASCNVNFGTPLTWLTHYGFADVSGGSGGGRKLTNATFAAVVIVDKGSE